MHSSRSVLPQQDRIQRYAAASDAFFFFNRLTAPDLFDVLEGSLPAHRERLFPPTETLSMFMAQALKPDRSCQGIVDDAAVKRLLHGLPRCSTKTGAYCKARVRLPLEMVSGMALASGQLIAGQVPENNAENHPESALQAPLGGGVEHSRHQDHAGHANAEL